MKANVIVRLKEAVHDPQGETIGNVLAQVGYGKVGAVRQGKFFELTLDVSSREEALRLAREIAARVLSNPVLEIFEVEVKG
ncbi:MAG TPA: phosphoribosylformylglycinamidine synthase subunit PurS [Vicinamibacteria bacterium]|jgi:phosphoribosylformylglycinamidine synthase